MQHLRLFLPALLAVGMFSCNSSHTAEKQPSSPGPKSSDQAALIPEVQPSVSKEQQDAGNEPASLADIERYYDVMQIRDQMKQLTEIMSQRIQQMMQENISTLPEMPPEAVKEFQTTYEKIMQQMPTEELLQAMAPIYAKHFSKNDINTIIDFYSSPVGKKMVTQTPAIAQEAMQASMGIMQKYMKDSMEEMQKTVEKVKEAQADEEKKDAATQDELLKTEIQKVESEKAAEEKAAAPQAQGADATQQANEEKAPVA